MERFDYLVVGSGLNSLVCASLLAKAGHSVCVLERNAQLGGCILSDSESLEGFTFDLMSTSHVQFLTSPAYAELAEELAAAGLEYCFNDRPVGAMLPDGRALVLTTDHAENVKRIAAVSQADADAYNALVETFGAGSGVVFGLLGNEPWSWATVRMLFGELRSRGLHGLVSLFRHLLQSTRESMEQDFESDEARALLTPGCLHCGLGPNESLSSIMGQLVTLSLAQAADPLVKGGSGNIVRAFEAVLEKYGATVLTDCDVVSIETSSGRVSGVITADGKPYGVGRGVVANVTPTQLYQRLLAADEVPAPVAEQAAAFRYGRSCVIVHIALDEKPRWADPEMADVALMHLTGGLDAVALAVSEAERGLLPADPTICVVQPLAVDPSRAHTGKWILWLQLLEVPRKIKGDAAGEISTPADGRWTAEVGEAFADRLVDRLSAVIPNLRENILYRRVLTPVDLEAMNMNLVAGDPYSGHCGVNQQLLFRPLPALKNHQTPVRGLYQIGASTHPGPGLGGMSGYLVAKSLI